MAKRCLLAAAAPGDDTGLKTALERGPYDWIVGVDGGLDALRRLGARVDAALGDFDSLGRVPGPEDAPGRLEVFDAHKDFTDLDRALSQMLESGFDETVVCGALGGRLDHTLGNLQLLCRQARSGQAVWCVGDRETVVSLHAPGSIDRIAFDAGAQGTCSVFATGAQAHGVSEHGLEYALEDATLDATVPMGVSNELIGSPAEVSVRDGGLWVFFPTACLDHVTLAGVPWRS